MEPAAKALVEIILKWNAEREEEIITDDEMHAFMTQRGFSGADAGRVYADVHGLMRNDSQFDCYPELWLSQDPTSGKPVSGIRVISK